MSTLVAFLAFFVTLGMFLVNRDKIRLELFEKRFRIYIAVMEYTLMFAHCEYNKTSDNAEYEEKLKNFREAFRQSRFLFKKEDGIYKCIENINQGAARVKAQSEDFIPREKYPEDTISLEKNLEELEKLLMPYLYFPEFERVLS